MRHQSLKLILLAFLAIAFTGCLKDKDLENNVYGITVGGINGVSFPEASSSPVLKGINSSDDPLEFEGTMLVLEQDKVSDKDITVTLAIDTAGLGAAELEELPEGSYSVDLTVVIPAGQSKSDPIAITFAKTSDLDPTIAYGIGLTIVAVDNGYVPVSNMKTITYGFNIKNQYDGVYHATGFLYHPALPRDIDEEKTLGTTGPNSVYCALGDLGGSGYYAEFTVDPNTNKVTVTPLIPLAFTQFDGGLPGSSPGYTAQWSESALCNNTWDPATKTFYVRYGYMGGSGWRVTEEKIVMQP
jgi:hypothetical protein